MVIDKNIVLERQDKKPILIDTFYSEQCTNQPILIFCHGYKGFKDWGAWNLMAQSFASSGFCFMKFNFSHNGGTINNPIDFPDLEAFGHNNYSKELDDLDAVINWTQTHFNTNSNVDINKIYLIGHSRGGGIAIIKASEDSRIKKLITLASISDFGRRTATTGNLSEWKETGVKYVLNGRTRQQMPHFYQFYEDFKANEERLNIRLAAANLKIPMLIIHGDNDRSISLLEAKELKKCYPKAKLEIVKDADHVFNIRHPWNQETPSIELFFVNNLVLDFLAT